MHNADIDDIDSVVPLFDVVISMPPGTTLDSVEHLASTEAGLPPDRVERLITVLSSSPNAKVGSALTLARAEEEQARFVKAGLLVNITPVLAVQTNAAGSYDGLNTETAAPNSPATSTRAPLSEELLGKSKGGWFKGNTAAALASVAAIALGLLYIGEKGVTVGGMALPWGKKPPPLSAGVIMPGLQQLAGPAAANDSTSEADVNDPVIQAANAAGGAAAGAAAPPDGMPQLTRQLLTADFANLLAELGQSARAREVLKALAGGMNPVADAPAALALQAAQIKLQAWSVQRMDAGPAAQTAQALKSATQAIANPQERTLLQGQVAVILSRSTQLPPDVPRAFLALGAESSKAVTGAQASAVLGHLLVSMAEVFLYETTACAKTSAWVRAKASATQVEDLVKQAPDAFTQARLHAADHQAKLQTGQVDKAAKSLDSALAWAGKNSNLPERAAWLRSIAQLTEAATQEQFETAANSLQNLLSSKSGMEKAQGLTELSLLYTAAGLPGKASQLRSQAQATTGLNALEVGSINTDLVVRGDMAMAKMLHSQGRYAEADAALQRISSYLF